jgi:hypothetical protein
MLEHFHQPTIHARHDRHMLAGSVPNNGQWLLSQELLIGSKNFIDYHSTRILS